MVIANKNGPGKGRAGPSTNEEPTEGVEKDAGDAHADPTVEEQLVQARASRSQAESARQRIVTEIMEASKDLYQKLVSEGEQILSRAKQLEADAELRDLEVQRELEHSHRIKAEADSYREKMISQTQKQAQEMVQQAQSIKAEAVAFREKLLAQVREQAQQELEQAQAEKIEADAYRERVIAQSQSQAQEILDQARSAAEQEGAEIVQKYTLEAEKLLAQAELIRAAAQEQLEAQRLYTEVAQLETESKEVLERARTQLDHTPLFVQDISDVQFSSPDPSPGHGALDQLPPEEHRPETEHFSPHKNRESSPVGANPSKGNQQLPDNALVVGVEIDGHSKAYPLQVVTEARVINDTLHHQDLLVTFGPPSELGMVFKRNVDGRALTFRDLPESSNGLMLMQDCETGTIWEALTGRAIRGTLAPGELEHLTSEYSFWFAWCDLHPQTEIYSPDQNILAQAPD